MRVERLWALGMVLGLLAFANRAIADDDVLRVAGEIDVLITEAWEKNDITPAPMSSDAEFLRRASLDITGRIPPASSVHDFLADDAPDKRRQLVDRLLGTATYIVHSTNLWRAAMIPEADADPQIRSTLPGFEAWLRARIAENRNYAEVVREMLTLPVDQMAQQQRGMPNALTPFAFYQAKENKPENLAAATSRIFLGVRLECAQCHDHFFDKWKQDDFWGYAAFFTGVDRSAMRAEGDEGVLQSLVTAFGTEADPQAIIPGTEIVVPARFLDGTDPTFGAGRSTRQVLADWVTSPKNPYFAKAAVNRVWANHFGIGLVNPVDDFSESNPASHPEVLDLLAREFVAHNFDVKYLIRVITATKAYNLTSRLTDESQQTPRMFARMSVRALTPEQIFDSIAQATGYQQPFNPEEPLNFNNDTRRQEFIETFANNSETATEKQSTILQALALMNGRFVSESTDLSQSRTLSAVAEAPFLSTGDKVETLFLATLNRLPSGDERTHFVEHIERATNKTATEKTAIDDDSRQRALGDVFWALLNTSEFLMNH